MPADPKDEDCGQQANREQSAPGDGLGQQGIEPGVDENRGSRADGPAGLDDADPATTIFIADHLAHQDRSSRPFAAEAEPVQGAQDKQLLEILGKGTEKGKDGIPQDRDLQHPHATEPVGEGAGEPPDQGRDQQCHRADQAGFAARQAPQRNHRRDHEAVHLDIERIQGPAAKARAHRPTFLGVQIAEPGEHCASPPFLPIRQRGPAVKIGIIMLEGFCSRPIRANSARETEYRQRVGQSISVRCP